MAYNSKYTGQEVENLLDQIAKGNTGGGGITSESDPIFSESPAFNITDEDIDSWNGKQDAIEDLDDIRSGAGKGATAVQPEDVVGIEPMVCAYRIASYTANHIELENYTYNGQTMNYREGAIISILNPNSADVVFEGGTLTLTLDGNEYEASAFTLKSGATALFSLGPDSGVLLPVSSVVESNSGGSSDESSNVIIVEDVPDCLYVNEAKTYRITRQVSGALTIAVETESYNTSTVIFETGDVAPSLLIENQAFWVNGNIPSIESHTVYELSLFHDERVGVMAVLSPFKLA